MCVCVGIYVPVCLHHVCIKAPRGGVEELRGDAGKAANAGRLVPRREAEMRMPPGGRVLGQEAGEPV